MIYIMNAGRPLGIPSEYYLQTIVEGYMSAGFYKPLHERAVKDSLMTCHLKSKLML